MKILIFASGTGGHLIPAQQLAAELIAKGHSVEFMGHNLGSNRNFRKDFFKFTDIPSSAFNKKTFLKAFFVIFLGLAKSLFYLLKIKPDLVAGFGSYHSFPPLLAACLLRKKIALFESNTSLGKVNRLFAKKASILALQFPCKDKKDKNIRIVKMLPWNLDEKKEVHEDRASLGLKNSLFTFLVFGGSQGADFINSLFLDCVEGLKDRKDFQVIHLTGSQTKEEEIRKKYLELGIISCVKAYEKNMKTLYRLADLAICRSGASTLGELVYFEVPSFLIPYPHSSEGHQIENANYMEKNIRGGYLFLQSGLDAENLLAKIVPILEKNDKNFLEIKENLSNYKKTVKNENRKSLAEIILE